MTQHRRRRICAFVIIQMPRCLLLYKKWQKNTKRSSVTHVEWSCFRFPWPHARSQHNEIKYHNLKGRIPIKSCRSESLWHDLRSFHFFSTPTIDIEPYFSALHKTVPEQFAPTQSTVISFLSLPQLLTLSLKKAPPIGETFCLCVGITYLPGKSPCKYCRRRWA